MKNYKNFIQKVNHHLYLDVFCNLSKGVKDKDKIKNMLLKSIESFCYKNLDYKEMLHHKQLIDFILHENLGLGAIDILLQNKSISEIMINGPDQIFYEQQGKLYQSNLFFSSEDVLKNIVYKIASSVNRRIDHTSPMVDARLADGSRFNAIIHPLALNGTTVTIRKFFDHNIGIHQLIQGKTLCAKSAQFLKHCVALKKNILIAGGTGSGKTTLLNILSAFIPNTERIISIEDSAELNLKQEHVIRLETRTKNNEHLGEIRIRDLLKNSLRMRPDRIIVGECRSEEIMDMLQAMNTGHDGSMTTLHANNASDALKRIENLILMSGYNYPIHAIRDQIVSSIDLIIFIQRDASGQRSIKQISEVSHMEGNNITLLDIFKYENGKLHWAKCFPKFMQYLQENERNTIFKLLKSENPSS